MIDLTNFKPKSVQISSAIFEPNQLVNHGKTKLTGNSHAQSPGCTHCTTRSCLGCNLLNLTGIFPLHINPKFLQMTSAKFESNYHTKTYTTSPHVRTWTYMSCKLLTLTSFIHLYFNPMQMISARFKPDHLAIHTKAVPLHRSFLFEHGM